LRQQVHRLREPLVREGRKKVLGHGSAGLVGDDLRRRGSLPLDLLDSHLHLLGGRGLAVGLGRRLGHYLGLLLLGSLGHFPRRPLVQERNRGSVFGLGASASEVFDHLGPGDQLPGAAGREVPPAVAVVLETLVGTPPQPPVADVQQGLAHFKETRNAPRDDPLVAVQVSGFRRRQGCRLCHTSPPKLNRAPGPRPCSPSTPRPWLDASSVSEPTPAPSARTRPSVSPSLPLSPPPRPTSCPHACG